MDRMFIISPVGEKDISSWLQMRCQLWSEGTEAEHKQEIEQYYSEQFPRSPWHVLMAKDQEGNPAGFAELSVRPYAEGCKSTHVAYLEGWFVAPEFRRSGVGSSLIQASESWAREQGLTEFASDTDPGNTESIAAHYALGFRDAGLVQCFIKRL